MVARGSRKIRVGSVVRVRQDKTAVVEMVWKQRHRLYHKQVRRVARFHVHDPENQCRLGDVVRIEETRPISKTKHWRLLQILDRRQVAEVLPIELEGDAAAGLAGDVAIDSPPEEPELDLDDDIDPDILDQLVAGNEDYDDNFAEDEDE